jgi:paraquat-inducible protein B
MANRASSYAIGAFVLASLGLAAVAIVILGSGKLFARPHYFICMFQGSVNGLKVGAAVKARGVQIGSVQRIGLRLTPSEGALRQVGLGQLPLPVIIELDERELMERGASGALLRPEQFQNMINQGLRASLGLESLLTGVLYIELSFHPNRRAQFFIQPGSGPYTEIPTIPTNLEEIKENVTKTLAKLEKTDFNGLVVSITNAGNALDKLAEDPDLRQAIASINRIVGNPEITVAINHLDDTIGNVNKAVVAVKNTVDRTGPKLNPLIASLQQSSTDLQPALVQARSTLASFQLVVSPGSPVTHKLDSTLDQLNDASRSIHDLADYLQRNPSALIRGKYVSNSSE